MAKVEINTGRIIKPYSKTDITGVFDLKPWDNSQNGKQRRYYWKCLINVIADYTGYPPQEVHEKMAFRFLLIDDGKSKRIRSTEKLTAKEREVYHEDIRRFASVELELYLMLPNEFKDE